jgi:hypothetical protein
LRRRKLPATSTWPTPGACFGQQYPPARLLPPLQSLEDFLFRLDPEASELANPVLFGGPAQVVEGADPEPLVQGLGPLGAQAGHGDQVAQAGRHLTAQLPPERQVAGLQEGADLPGEVLADAGQFVQFLRRHLGQGLGKVADGAGGVAVGADPERVLPLEVQQVRHLLESLGDLGVFHGMLPESAARKHAATDPSGRSFSRIPSHSGS